MAFSFKVLEIFLPGFNVSDIHGMEGMLLNSSGNFFYSEFLEVKASQYLYLYVSPWLLFFGTMGNILSNIIMHRMSFRVWSTCLYMSVIPIVDLVILYVECGNNWILYLSKSTLNISQFLMVSSNALCKAYTFLFNFLLHISPWLVVAMLGECMLSLRFQRYTPWLCTREHTRAFILLNTVILICVNIQFFWTYGLTKPMASDSPYAVVLCTYIKEWAQTYANSTWPVISATIGHFLPFFVISALCLIISLTYVHATLSPKFRRSHNAKNDMMFQHFLDPVAFQEFQGTILMVGFAYLLLMLPQLGVIMYRYFLFSYQNVEYTLKIDAQLRLLDTIKDILHYIFLSCKFAIFYFSSRRFQREFRMIVQSICKPFTKCTKNNYSVKNKNIKEKTNKDEQRVKLVLDGQNQVVSFTENNWTSNSLSTDV